MWMMGFDKLSPNGEELRQAQPERMSETPLAPHPLALSSSKGGSMQMMGFDKLSPNGSSGCGRPRDARKRTPQRPSRVSISKNRACAFP